MSLQRPTKAGHAPGSSGSPLPPDKPRCHRRLFLLSHHLLLGGTSQVLVPWKVTPLSPSSYSPLHSGHSSPPRKGQAFLMHQEGTHGTLGGPRHSKRAMAARSKCCSRISSSDHGCVHTGARRTAPHCAGDGMGSTELTGDH